MTNDGLRATTNDHLHDMTNDRLHAMTMMFCMPRMSQQVTVCMP